jgi:hypothetical protein
MAMADRTFLVECYAPGIEHADVERAADRARTAASAAVAGGEAISYLGALLVSGDDAVFHAFTAAGEAPVEAVSRAAGLAFTRIVESISVPGAAAGPMLGLLGAEP